MNTFARRGRAYHTAGKPPLSASSPPGFDSHLLQITPASDDFLASPTSAIFVALNYHYRVD
jgi:hypothetical protein